MISVIIPTYNRKKFLSRAIDSVLNQTLQDFEIIVVDDGSTDHTELLFKTKYKNKKIRYEKFPVNQGVHIARNRGLDLSRGDYIAFLDSDDEWFPFALEKAHQVFLNNKNVGIVSAPYIFPNGELTGFKKSFSGIIPYKKLLCETGISYPKGGFVMLKKSIIGDIRWKVPYLQFIFFRRVAKKTNTYRISQPLGRYHYLNEPCSVTRKRRKPNIPLSIARARELVNFLDEFGEDIIKFCPKNYSNYSYGASVGLLLDGKKKKAIKFAWRSVKYNPQKIRYILFFSLSILPFSKWLLRILFKIKRRMFKQS